MTLTSYRVENIENLSDCNSDSDSVHNDDISTGQQIVADSKSLAIVEASIVVKIVNVIRSVFKKKEKENKEIVQALLSDF